MGDIWKIVISILMGINTAIIMEYLSFRFHLAENYVLKRDYTDMMTKILEKLDAIWEKLDKKADKE